MNCLIKKIINIITVLIMVITSVIPAGMAMASDAGIITKGDTAAAWPSGFSPYAKSDGNYILDPAGEPGISPVDVDITSGVDKGVGKLPSVYVASDSNNFFVRLRLKGDPYDRKGGFVSSVWSVQLAVNGVHQATIGLNGKSPHEDYVYVANADGSAVQPIYKTTTPGGNIVPGTKITPDGNGHYFLDFQVPIIRITEIAPQIDKTTPIQLYFATSKAANLSVVNKDGMGAGNSPSFSGYAKIRMGNISFPTIGIDGGASKEYAYPNLTMTGTVSAVSGSTVIVELNGTPYSPTVTGSTWSLVLQSGLAGGYTAVAKVTDPKAITQPRVNKSAYKAITPGTRLASTAAIPSLQTPRRPR